MYLSISLCRRDSSFQYFSFLDLSAIIRLSSSYVPKQNVKLLRYVRICDTAGQEAYDHVRPLNYHDNVDVVFIAFSIVNRQSFNNVKKRWHEEQQKYMKSAKVTIGQWS